MALGGDRARHLTEHGSHQDEDGTCTWKFDHYTHRDQLDAFMGEAERFLAH